MGAGLQDDPAWHKIRIHNRSKIDPKGYETKMQIVSGFGHLLNDFWWILMLSWDQVGTKLAPSWGQVERVGIKFAAL